MAARRNLVDLVRARAPDLDAPEDAIAEGRVRVDGSVVVNPRSQVQPGASIVIDRRRELQGVRKLGFALDAFGVQVGGRVAIDVGASTGGFTTALLDRGAACVYAVDVGYGQLLGSLRLDPRVVNLERTNVADLTPARLGGFVECPADLVVVDVSKLSLAAAIAQLTANLDPQVGTELVGLVKPMFELRLAGLPTSPAQIDEAVGRAAAAASAHGWEVVATTPSAITGHRGAIEHFLHARRASSDRR